MRLNSNAILGHFGIIFSILKNVSSFNLAPHWLLMIASPDLGGHPILSGSGYALISCLHQDSALFPWSCSTESRTRGWSLGLWNVMLSQKFALASLFIAVLCLEAQSCLTLWDPRDFSLPVSSVHGDSPGKNTGVGCHALLQGSFSTQGSNLHCK